MTKRVINYQRQKRKEEYTGRGKFFTNVVPSKCLRASTGVHQAAADSRKELE
jgi:hypothetical protein